MTEQTPGSQTNSQTPDSNPQPAPATGELDPRIAELIAKTVKQAVAGTVGGSVAPRLESLERLLQDQANSRRREEVERMTPQQLKEQAVKAAETKSGPTASEYFRKLAQEFMDDAEVEVDLPEFEPGKPTPEYETLYRQLRKTVLDKVKVGSQDAAKTTVQAEVRRVLAEKGLDVIDTGGGVSVSGHRFTPSQLASMSPEEYAKAGGADIAFPG